MKKISIVIILCVISGTLTATDLTQLSKAARDNSVSNLEDITNRIPAKLNGREFIYLPDLTLAEPNTDIRANTPQVQSKSLTVAGDKQYGKFNNLSVVKKPVISVSKNAASIGDINSVSKNYSGFILLDQKRKKFEVTHGSMILELKPGQSIDDIVKDYSIASVSKISRQYVVRPSQASKFIELYSEISKDSRLEYVRLMLVPPLDTLR